MSEAVHETQPEFWRPPAPALTEAAAVRHAIRIMVEACPRCGTEFLPGSHFCHACGKRRPEADNSAAKTDAAAMAMLWNRVMTRLHSLAAWLSFGAVWEKIKASMLNRDWLTYLRVHEIRCWLGLPTGSLIAFAIGLGCVVAALLAGLLTVKTLLDWQAIQFYRAEWLLAATASFVAGILLKSRSGS